MEINTMANKEKTLKIKTKDTGMNNISFSDQNTFNQIYIDDLIKLKGFVSSAPTFIPKKFIEQIQFFYDGTDYKVYFYISNQWKSITLI